MLKQGRYITGTEQQFNRWAEHFEELLNRPATLDSPDIQPAIVNLPIKCDKPTKEEISRAIKDQKNYKATGLDDIPTEALTTDIDASVELLYPLFIEIWEKEVSSDWREGYLIKLPKKGNLSNCSNYRGITLLSVRGKVFNRVILEIMKGEIDPWLRDQQDGFCPNRSCIDQIAPCIIVEQSLE